MRRIWKEDILVADIELENLDASEIRARRLNAKVITRKMVKQFIFFDRKWKSKLIWWRSGSENIGIVLNEAKNVLIFEEIQTGLNQWSHFRRTVKPVTTSGQFLGSTFTVSTSNQESKSTCRKKNYRCDKGDTYDLGCAAGTSY